jgi:uncharacterized protein
MASQIIDVGQSRIANVFNLPRDAKIALERDVPATMRDGVRLKTNVFRPAAEGRYPVLLHLAPLGKDKLPADHSYDVRIPNTGVIRVSEWAVFEGQDPVYWVPHGYVVVVADCRATFESEGGHFEHYSPQMARDFHDLVEWAAGQPWCDGNVGSNGVSYLAIVQWLGAAQRPPHLKAIIPWEGLNDPYREWAFHGGIPDTGFFRGYMGRARDSNATFIRKGATFEDMLDGQREHPLYDEYWQRRHPDLSRIDVPAYVCASWSSDLHVRGALNAFRSISSKHKWLEIHGRKEWESFYSREAVERQRRFMDQFLKGVDTGILDTPRVRIEVRDRFYDSVTRFADDWPAPGTDYRKLYLDIPNAALVAAPLSNSSSLRYRALKADNERDKAEFSLTFERRTELVGHTKLRLWVSVDGADDMDIHVGLRKFDRRGREVHFPDFDHYEQGMVAAGWQRASHRELDDRRSTPWQPWLRHQRLMKLKAGDIVPLEIEVLPSGTVFNAGEQLRLVVQGYDIIDFWYRHAHKETVNDGHHVIHAGGNYDSHLLLPFMTDRA